VYYSNAFSRKGLAPVVLFIGLALFFYTLINLVWKQATSS
jgi:hypothetical protein